METGRKNVQKRRFQHFIKLSDVEKIFGHHSKGKLMDKIMLNTKMVIYYNIILPYGKVTVIKSLFLSKITHLLLSLPSPKKTLFTEINTLFKNFLWNNKPAKFRKEIIEADILDGGLRLHNLEKFDLALKLGWAKRMLKSESKWTIFPTYWDLYDVFTYGPDKLDRIEDIIYNPFWSDFITSIKCLFKTDIITQMDIIHEVPIWFNPNLRIDFKKEWFDKGIRTLNDIVDTYGKPMDLQTFKEIYQVKTNFLEYGGFCKKIKSFLRYKDFPHVKTTLPRNSYINIIVSKDKKGVSNLYRSLQGRHYNIIEENCNKWNVCIEVNLIPAEISKSYKRHSTLISDTYAKYIQFRTLHQRFFTNDRLFKIGIKKDPSCNMCNTELDSNSHMILYCEKSRKLWSDVERWINHLGVRDYKLTENSIITGDIHKSRLISIIILYAKITIYSAKLKDKTPNFFNFKNLLKQEYIHSKYLANITNNTDKFEKDWHLLVNEWS